MTNVVLKKTKVNGSNWAVSAVSVRVRFPRVDSRRTDFVIKHQCHDDETWMVESGASDLDSEWICRWCKTKVPEEVIYTAKLSAIHREMNE